MGQRLVVTVTEDDERICTVYYHWSAYSISALYCAKQLIQIIESDKDKIPDTRLRIIRGIEKDHGLLDKNDMEEARRIWPGEHFEVLPGANRNDGIVSITEASMNNSDGWAEGTGCLDISNRTYDNEEFFWYENKESVKEELRECEYEEDEIAEMLGNIVHLKIDQGEIPFDKIDEAIKELTDASLQTDYCYNKDGDIIQLITG